MLFNLHGLRLGEERPQVHTMGCTHRFDQQPCRRGDARWNKIQDLSVVGWATILVGELGWTINLCLFLNETSQTSASRVLERFAHVVLRIVVAA